jgi:hypothetical protein
MGILKLCWLCLLHQIDLNLLMILRSSAWSGLQLVFFKGTVRNGLKEFQILYQASIAILFTSFTGINKCTELTVHQIADLELDFMLRIDLLLVNGVEFRRYLEKHWID